MSEEPATVLSEVPSPTTEVQEGGPTSFKEAAEKFFSTEQVEEAVEPEADLTDLLEPPAPVKKEEVEPETKEKPVEKVEPEIEVEEFGFEKEGDEEPEAEDDFDAEEFDKETEKQIEGIDPKAQDGWKKLRARLKEAETKAREASASSEKLAELEKVTAEMEDLRARNEELQATDYTLKVQNSPEYRDKIAGPTQELRGLADQIAQEYSEEGITAEEVLNAIREPSLKKRGERIQLLRDKGVDDLIVSEVQSGHATFRKLQADHERMLGNAETEWKEVQAKREAESLKAQEEDRSLLKRHLNENWEKAAKIFGEDSIKSGQKRSGLIDIREETPKNRAYAQMAGEAFPLALAEIQSLKKQLSEAGVKLGQSKAASPSLSEGATDKADEVEDKAPKTLAEAMRRLPSNMSL